jgi:hypothetical protein
MDFSMFLRWKRRKRRNPKYWTGKVDEWIDDVHWAAIVVENVRIDGKTTQRHIAYLGGITESAIRIAPQRCFFWDGIDEKLRSLKLAPPDRRRIKDAVALKVARPTKAEFQQAKRNRAKLGTLASLKP